MRFEIPESLTPVTAINHAKFIANASADSSFEYDFSAMQYCHPFGLLIVGSAIRRNREHYPNATHERIWNDRAPGNRFAADIGFLRYTGWEKASGTVIHADGVNHIPITCIGLGDLRKSPEDSRPLGELIDIYAESLAFTLTQDKTAEATKCLQYCLREIIRNTFDHGKTNQVWVCGQYWPSRKKAELALLDEGRGIWAGFRQNRLFRVRSDEEANSLALEPGASRMVGCPQDEYDGWHNSGYGLFMSSKLCSVGEQDDFLLGSGKSAVLVNAREQIPYEADIRGTAVCMNVKLDQIDDFGKRLSELAGLGRVQAQKYSDLRFQAPSRASTTPSMRG